MSEVHRVVKNRNYTVMSNYHLRDMNLSLKAKGLLSLILSLPDNWKFSVRGLADINKEGVGCIGATLKELEAGGYLQRITHRKKGKIDGTEYIFYEKSQLDKILNENNSAPKNDKPQTKKANPPEPHTENPDTVISDTESEAQLNTNKSNTETSNTDLLNTYPINSNEPVEDSSKPTTEPIKPKQPERIGMDKILAYRQFVKQNIEYDILCQKLNGNIGMLNEIVDIITETVCTTREYLTVASEKRDAETVKSQLLKLNSEHIEYVLDCMKNNTTDVRSTRQYLLAALYNATSTIDTYYTLKVNHDMYGGNLK